MILLRRSSNTRVGDRVGIRGPSDCSKALPDAGTLPAGRQFRAEFHQMTSCSFLGRITHSLPIISIRVRNETNCQLNRHIIGWINMLAEGDLNKHSPLWAFISGSLPKVYFTVSMHRSVRKMKGRIFWWSMSAGSMSARTFDCSS